jgi:hypothetical protein
MDTPLDLRAEESLRSFGELAKFLAAIGARMDEIWMRWWDWHLNTPDVEFKLLALARKAQRAGLTHYGISPIWEVLRWHLSVDAGRIEEFRCSNDYRSRYARYLMWKYPDIAGFFNTRPLHVEKAA